MIPASSSLLDYFAIRDLSRSRESTSHFMPTQAALIAEGSNLLHLPSQPNEPHRLLPPYIVHARCNQSRSHHSSWPPCLLLFFKSFLCLALASSARIMHISQHRPSLLARSSLTNMSHLSSQSHHCGPIQLFSLVSSCDRTKVPYPCVRADPVSIVQGSRIDVKVRLGPPAASSTIPYSLRDANARQTISTAPL
jgi:hypothetical protein